MIGFIRKNKNLRNVFEEAENKFDQRQLEQAQLYATAKETPTTDQTINEQGSEGKLKKEPHFTQTEEIENSKEIYQVICESFCHKLEAKNINYESSLIKVNMLFSQGLPSYKLTFPLVNTGETQSQVFINSLKDVLKEHVGKDYSLNLCLKQDDETHNILLSLERIATQSEGILKSERRKFSPAEEV